MARAKTEVKAELKGKGGEKVMTVRVPLSLWSWMRERSVAEGSRSVGGWLKGLVEKERGKAREGGDVESGEVSEDSAALTKREMTERKEALIDEWMLGLLEDPETLNALPPQTKASIFMQRLPKMGVSKGEMEEKALSIRAALKGLGEYEDLQGEMVTMREEVRRLRKELEGSEGEVELLRGQLEMIRAEHEGARRYDGRHAGFVLDLHGYFRLWREGVRDALLGRAAAKRCRMLREDRLVDKYAEEAVRLAEIELGVTMVKEEIVEKLLD